MPLSWRVPSIDQPAIERDSYTCHNDTPQQQPRGIHDYNNSQSSPRTV